MCGIFGFFQNKPVDGHVAAQMSRSLRHRGPDDEGFLLINRDSVLSLRGDDSFTYNNEELEVKESDHLEEKNRYPAFSHLLGHRRLSIQDLSSLGHQPMSYRERYWIVYNGEIYNYIELRSELEKLGHYFISNSDTEVILAAYDEWGVECLHRFNGMWSFVLYDVYNRYVFIARDRFGVKPFYYYCNGDVFVFASEPKAIFSHPDVVKQPNVGYLEKYILQGASEYLRETAFDSIYRLDHAKYVLCDVDDLVSGNFEQLPYWQLLPNLSAENFSEQRAIEYSKQYRDLLEDAVRIRMRADVKIGSALSGGLDSSSIVFLVNKVLLERGSEDLQETFSCVYKTKGTEHCDESEYIDLLSRKLAVNSNKIEPLWNEVPAEHKQMIYAMDTPPDNTCMSGWYTFKKVAESSVRVTLDGQGADEQLAGYLGYIHIYLSFVSIRELVAECRSFWRVPGAKKHILAGVLFNVMTKFGLSVLRDMLARKVIGSEIGDSLNRRLVADSMSSMITLIHYSDRVSMAHSIESRMPFLDYRLAEFLAALPACYKIHRGWTKYLARLAFDDVLPNDVCWRKDKMGWPIPEQYWLKGKLKPWYLAAIDNLWMGLPVPLTKLIPSDCKKAPNTRLLNLAAWLNLFKVVR